MNRKNQAQYLYKFIVSLNIILFILLAPFYAMADTIITKNESVLTGCIVSMNDTLVEIQTSDGLFELSKSNIKTIQFSDNSSQKTDPTKDKQEIIIPSGFGVPFHFKETLDGNKVQEDQRVNVIVDQDVYLEDQLVFKKGTEGYASIDTIQKAKSWGRPGRLAISVVVFKDIFDTEHTLTIDMERKGQSSHIMGQALPIVGGALVAFPLLLFGFKKGDKVMITPESIFVGYTLTSKTTCPHTNNDQFESQPDVITPPQAQP